MIHPFSPRRRVSSHGSAPARNERQGAAVDVHALGVGGRGGGGGSLHSGQERPAGYEMAELIINFYWNLMGSSGILWD